MSVCAELFVEFSGEPAEQRLRQIQHRLLNVMQANSRNIFELSPERLFLHSVVVKITDVGIEKEDQQWSWQQEEENALASSAVYRIEVGALRAYNEHSRSGPMMSYLTIFMSLLQIPEVVGVYLGSDNWHQLPRLREPEIIAKFKDFAAHGFEPSTFKDTGDNAPTCPFCAEPMHRSAYGGDRGESSHTIPFTCSACGTSAQVIGAEALEFVAGRPYKVARYIDFTRNIVFAGDAKTVIGKWNDKETERWWRLQQVLKLYENKVGQDGVFFALAEYFRVNHDPLGLHVEKALKEALEKLANVPDDVVVTEAGSKAEEGGLIARLVKSLN